MKKMFSSIMVSFFICLFSISTLAADIPGFSEDYHTGVSHPIWMSSINDNRRLSELSIPGTHDTMAHKDALFPGNPVYDYTITQSMRLNNQLDAGIRFVDIRANYQNGQFLMNHGAVYLNSTFQDVINYSKEFLNTNPSETIFMRIQQQHSKVSNDDFVARLKQYMNSEPGLFYTNGESNPTLGKMRGKIVILLDVEGNHYYSMGVLNYWNAIIQDEYKTVASAKVEKVKDHLHLSNNRSSTSTIYINYLSGTDNIGYLPRNNAAYVNPRVTNYFDEQDFNYVGIVVADYPGKELIQNVINRNIPIPNGTIASISPVVNGESKLYVIDMSVLNNSDVTMYEYHGGNHQKWRFEYNSTNNRYSIRNVADPSKALYYFIADEVSRYHRRAYATQHLDQPYAVWDIQEVVPGEFLLINHEGHHLRRKNDTTQNFNGLTLEWPGDNNGNASSRRWKLII